MKPYTGMSNFGTPVDDTNKQLDRYREGIGAMHLRKRRIAERHMQEGAQRQIDEAEANRNFQTTVEGLRTGAAITTAGIQAGAQTEAARLESEAQKEVARLTRPEAPTLNLQPIPGGGTAATYGNTLQIAPPPAQESPKSDHDYNALPLLSADGKFFKAGPEEPWKPVPLPRTSADVAGTYAAPGAQSLTAAPIQQEKKLVRRRQPDGRIALFDPDTQQFIRFE